MKRLSVSAAIACLALCAASTFAAPTAYTITQSGGVWRYGTINDSGQVATVITSVPKSGVFDGTSFTEFEMIGASIFRPYGINNSGTVVGHGNGVYGVSHAYVWNAGHFTDLGQPGQVSFANAINNSGLIVGLSGNSACTWTVGDSGVTANVLPSYEAGGDSKAVAVNNNGVVIGLTRITTQPGAGTYACVWTGGEVKLLSSELGKDTMANGINDSGTIVGAAYVSGSGSPALHPVVWSGTTSQDLGLLPGFSQAYANAINNKGQIVGVGSVGSGYNHALLWDQGKAYDLNSLLPAESGWVVMGALDINESGQILAWGSHNGQIAQCILTPVPEPSSVLALISGIGFVGILARKRRR